MVCTDCGKVLSPKNQSGLCKEHYRKDPAYRRKMSRSVTAAKAPFKLSEEERRKRKSAGDRRYRSENAEKLRERKRQYRSANKDKIAERDHRYYQDNRERLLKYATEYQQTHKKERNGYLAKYRAENKEYLREYHRKWHEDNKDKVVRYRQEYYKANRVEIVEQQRKYNLNHRAEAVERSRRRKARKANAGEEHFTEAEFERLCDRYGWICLCCGISHSESPLQRDHVIPLSRGGSDAISNIQPLCGLHNNQKGSKIIDWRCEL